MMIRNLMGIIDVPSWAVTVQEKLDELEKEIESLKAKKPAAKAVKGDK